MNDQREGHEPKVGINNEKKTHAMQSALLHFS